MVSDIAKKHETMPCVMPFTSLPHDPFTTIPACAALVAALLGRLRPGLQGDLLLVQPGLRMPGHHLLASQLSLGHLRERE